MTAKEPFGPATTALHLQWLVPFMHGNVCRSPVHGGSALSPRAQCLFLLMTVQGRYHYPQTVWLVVWTILLSHLGEKLPKFLVEFLGFVAYNIWTVSFFFSPCGPNSNPGLSAFLCVRIFGIFLKLLQFFASESGNLSAIVLKLETIIFQLPWKLAVMFTCKYFKFGLNTTGFSQSHFRNFSACSIKASIPLHL